MADWQELTGLAERHGPGFWLLDTDRLRGTIESFQAAFERAGWPDTRLGWSVKTLWAEAAVRTALAAGCLGEVVSRHERDLVLALGASPGGMIINGPLKTADDILWACQHGAVVNLDGPDEVEATVELARAQPGLALRVGLRANVDVGQGDRGRFGIDAEDGSLARAHRQLESQPGVRVVGLHLHISGARPPVAFGRRAERLVALADELWPAGGPAGPEYLDIGGGFAGQMPESLAAQLDYPAPSPDDYASAIVAPLLRRWPRGGPRLYLEPGVALAADAMSFAARVDAVKAIGGVRHAIVTGSAFLTSPARHRYELPHRVVRAPGRAGRAGQQPTVVSGWTCVEDDILVRSLDEDVEVGDWLLVENCGAYTFTLAPRFIRGVPAVLVPGADGWVEARGAETVRDWLSGQRSD